MSDLVKITALIKKDLLLELRQQYSFYGILLYVAATTFVLYLAIDNPDAPVWNGLYWVLQLFICTNAVAKSFLGESRGRMLYYNNICSAENFILAKLFFNIGLMLAINTGGYFLFTLLLGSPTVHTAYFLGIAFLGAVSLSMVFTFIAAIAAKASGNAAVMAILGFPVVIPQLLLLLKLSATTFSINGSIQLTPLLLLIGLNVMVLLLALVLFPFLWKD